MIVNPEWLKPKEKPYFHQISLVCIGRLIECVGRIDKGELKNQEFQTPHDLEDNLDKYIKTSNMDKLLSVLHSGLLKEDILQRSEAKKIGEVRKVYSIYERSRGI